MSKRPFVFLLGILSLLLPSLANSTEGEGCAEVHLLEAGSRAPLAGMLILSEEDEAFSDAEGLATLCGSVWPLQLEIDEPGYLKESFSLERGEQRLFFLEPAEAFEETGYIYQTHEKGEKISGLKRVAREEMETLPGAHGDPLQAALVMPEVSRPNFGLSVVAFRGGLSEDTLSLYGEIPLPASSHLAGMRTVLSSSALAGVELQPSIFGVSHGRKLGGLVRLVPRSDGERGAEAKVDLIESSAQARLEERVGRVWTVSARRSYLDAFAPVIGELTGVDFGFFPRFWDLSVILEDREIGRKTRWGFLGSSDAFELELGTGFGEDAEGLFLEGYTSFFRFFFEEERALGWARLLSAFSVGGLERFNEDYWDRYRVHGGDATLREVLRFGSGDTSVDVGVDLVHQSRESTSCCFGVAKESARPPRRRLLSAAFVEVGHRSESVDWTIGARVDHDDALGELVGDVRGSLRWETGEGWVLSARGGTMSQSPSSLDFFSPDHELTWARSIAGELGALWGSSEHRMEVEVKTYGSRIWGLPRPMLGGDNWFAKSSGEGWQAGAEVSAKWRPHSTLDLAMVLALGWSEVKRSEARGWHESFTNQPLRASTWASWRFGGRWRLGARISLALGPPMSSDARVLMGSSLRERWREPISVDPFFRVDARLERSWLFDLWSLSAYLDVQGLNYRRNVDMAWRSGYTGTPSVIYGLPILPFLGAKASW